MLRQQQHLLLTFVQRLVEPFQWAEHFVLSGLHGFELLPSLVQLHILLLSGLNLSTCLAKGEIQILDSQLHRLDHLEGIGVSGTSELEIFL